MSSAIVIPARYNSSRFPGKPLEKIGGDHMIAMVARKCMESNAERVVVATDDVRILEICEKIDGLEVTMSDKYYNSGTDRVSGIARFLGEDNIINVQGDEPFIPVKLLNNLIDDLENNGTYFNSAYVEIDEIEAMDNNCVKVVLDKNGYGIYFSRSQIPYAAGNNGVRYKKHIGVYGFKKDFLITFSNLEPTYLESTEKLEQLRALESGYKIKMIESDIDPLSVDTKADIERANKLLKNDK